MTNKSEKEKEMEKTIERLRYKIKKMNIANLAIRNFIISSPNFRDAIDRIQYLTKALEEKLIRLSFYESQLINECKLLKDKI